MNLLQLARPQNALQTTIVFAAVSLVFIFGTIAWTARETVSFNDPPEEIRDGVYYDNMAQCLLKGQGIAFDFRDPAWQQRYHQLDQQPGFEGKLSWVQQEIVRGPTASRPPGYPVLLATVYRLVGWRWDAVRLIDCILVSLGLATLITWSWCRWGAIPALVSTGTLLLDFSVMTFAGYILTEPLATALVCVLFVVVAAASHRSTVGRWLLAGTILALLMYVRGTWNLWWLMLAMASPLLLFRGIRNRLLPVTPRHIAVFLLTPLLLAAPYWVRNCVVTGHFQPLGTGGSMGLVGAWCDESLADHGNWQHLVFHEHKNAVVSRVADHSKWTTAQWEYEIGRQSAARAMDWAIQNWFFVPKLATERLITHWGLYQPLPVHVYAANVWLLVVGCAGIYLAGDRVRFVLVVILVLDSAVIMATWAHQGRYAIPLRPLIHLGYGLAAVMLLQWIIHQAARLRTRS